MPQHDWMLEVISDMRDYAAKNRMPKTGFALDALIDIAASEFSGDGAAYKEKRGNSETFKTGEFWK